MQVACTDFYGKARLVDPKDLVDRSSAYGVYIVDQKVLLIQDPRSLRWDLPGGGIEKDETIRRGLIREFIEETGVTPKGKFRLLTEWIEYYFDVPSNQAWRSDRKFYSINEISFAHKLLTAGNDDDSATAAFMPLDKLQTLRITDQIRKVIELGYLRKLSGSS